MGKYANLKKMNRGLNNTQMMAKWAKLIKAGIVKEPEFWPAMQRMPPYPQAFTQRGTLQEIVFPEDELFKVYMKRNEDWRDEVVKAHKKARENDEKTRGFLFVTQWQKYMDHGMEKEEAYKKVDEEFKAIERETTEKALDEEVELLISGKHPTANKWYAEEEPYVQEALDHHKLEWEAKHRAARVAQDMKEEMEEAQAAAAEELKREREEAIKNKNKKVKEKKAAADEAASE